MGRIRILVLVLVAGGLAAPAVWGPGLPARADGAGTEWHPDLVFGEADGKQLRLNLARPADLAEPGPAVLVIHGGGWVTGHRTMHDRLVRRLAAEGFVAVTVSYRLAPRNPWPAQIEDVKCAVRWLRAHADEWKIDPERIAAMGFSAGAHLSMLLGTMGSDDGLEGQGGWPGFSSKVQAVVSFFGPTDFAAEDIPEGGRRVLDTVLGPTFAADRRLASPVHYVDRSDAAMLLFQGTLDPMVAKSQALLMADALTDARVDGRVVLLIGKKHGWGEPLLGETLDQSIQFLRVRLSAVSPGTGGR